MARRVFFSFHFERDIWRVNQVRMSNVVAGADSAGFFDESEYEDAKKRGDEAIKRLIREKLDRTSATIVLIGAETATRPYVMYEIDESLKRGNGLIGIHIHHLKNAWGATDSRGVVPYVPTGVSFPTYDWDYDLNRLRNEIEEAGKRSELAALMKALSFRG